MGLSKVNTNNIYIDGTLVQLTKLWFRFVEGGPIPPYPLESTLKQKVLYLPLYTLMPSMCGALLQEKLKGILCIVGALIGRCGTVE